MEVSDSAGGDAVHESYKGVLKALLAEEEVDYANLLKLSQEKLFPLVSSMDFMIPSGSPAEWLAPENRTANLKALEARYAALCAPFRLDYREVERECPDSSKDFQPRSPTKISSQASRSLITSPSKRSLKAELAVGSPRPPVMKDNKAREELAPWLEGLLPAANEPMVSSTLTRFFEACGTSPADSICKRFETLAALSLSSEQQQAVQRLYYRLLETMLTEEEARLKKSDFTPLLYHDVFHHSLLGCCLEVVAFVHGIQAALFPKCLSENVTAFELSKIIDNVLRYEKTMPLMLRQHMKAVDHKILESYLWKPSSPVFDLLKRGGKQQQEHLEKILRLRISQARSPAVPAMSSPTPSKLAERSQLYSPVKAPGPMVRSLSLELIYRKVLELMVSRTRKLVQDLKMVNMLEQIVVALIHEVTSQFELLEGRHLDQMMICTVYGVARVMKIDVITFRRILQHYRTQSHTTSAVWKRVPLPKGGSSDIIEFYNTVFIGNMESYLLRFQTNPMQLPIATNVFDSPVKVSTVASPLARGTGPASAKRGLTYNVGQSPVKDLQRHNHDESSDAHKRVRKRLFSDPSLAGDAAPLPPLKKCKSEESPAHLAEAITSLTNNSLSSKQPSILRSSK